MIEKFITIDNQILTACIGSEIKIVRMDRNPVHNIVQVYDHMIQSQSRSGRLELRISDSLFEIVRKQYMTELGIGRKHYWEYIAAVPPAISFELAIIAGDPTDRATWNPQVKWQGCVIDENEFKPCLSLNNDELIMHTLPIDFANMRYYCEDKDCSSLLSDTPE